MANWHRTPLAFALLSACYLLAEPARGETSAWVGGTSGSWELPSNWLGGVPEGSGATAGLAGDSFIAVGGTHALDAIEVLGSNQRIVLSGTDAAFSVGQIYLGGSNNSVHVQPALVSDDVISIANLSNDSLLAIDRISTTSHLLISASGLGTSITIGHAEAKSINVDGNAKISVGLGAGIENIFIQPGVERFRITSADPGFHGNILSYGGTVDVATDYSVVSSPTLIQGGSLEISGGGKIVNRFDRTTVGGIQNLTLSGGELVRSNAAGLTLQSLIVGAQGASKLTFEDGSSSTLSAVNLLVEDRTGTLLIRGAGLGTTNRILLSTAPALVGSGTTGTPQVGILGQIVVDADDAGGGTGFATYTGSTGIRALTEAEYSSTLQANANVRLTVTSGIGTPTTINSLIMDGGRALSGAPISITSGMLLSTGGTNRIQSAGISSSVGYLNLITASDLVLSGAVNPNNVLVKSGTAAFHYQAPSVFNRAIINEGTFQIITGPSNNGDVTVNSGGRLFTHGAQRINSLSEVEINAGGTWELDNGSSQRFDRVVAGAGTVYGGGAQVNSLEFSSNSGDIENLDVRFTGNLTVEILSGQFQLNNTANDYTGKTQIGSSGKLLVGVDNALSANSVIEFDSGGLLSLQGRSATVAGLTSFPVGGTIQGGGNGAVSRLEVRAAAGQDYHYTGELSKALLIEKTGAGAQGIGGTIGDDVAFDVQEGTLTLSGGFSSAAQPISVRSEGTLVLDIYTSTTAPQILMEAGGTVTRVAASTFPTSPPISAQCLDGRATQASLLAIQGVANITSQFGLFEAGETVSDIFSLDGLDGMTFVLQLTFDPDEWAGDPALLTLGWRDGSEWIPAYAGNSVDQHDFLGFQSWDSDPTLKLGDWGIDLDSHAVWMVLDHNSDFALIAIPEPSAALLFAGGSVIFLLSRRRGIC